MRYIFRRIICPVKKEGSAKKLLLLGMIFFSIPFNGRGQTVTLKASNVAIQSLFPEIKKQTGYSFFYDVDLIARAKKVSVNIKKQPLKAVLELLFSGQPFTYSIEGRIITLSPLPVQRPTAAVQTQIEIVVVQN